MKSVHVPPFLLVCVVGLSCAQAEELATANVGDWVEYSVHTGNVGTIERRTVTAKDDKSITIKAVVRAVYKADVTHVIVIPLNTPYNPAVNDPDAKVEKIAEGDQKIAVGGRDTDTHWIQYKGTNKSGAAIQGKVWISNDVALGGMVKMEAPGSHVEMNLTKTSADK